MTEAPRYWWIIRGIELLQHFVASTSQWKHRNGRRHQSAIDKVSSCYFTHQLVPYVLLLRNGHLHPFNGMSCRDRAGPSIATNGAAPHDRRTIYLARHRYWNHKRHLLMAKWCFRHSLLVSGAGESHPRALPEPCVNVSAHTAPITQLFRTVLFQPRIPPAFAVDPLGET